MIEIRSYHYLPEKFDAYKTWAIEDAVPFLRANLNLVGFWMDNGREPELSGADPVAHKHGVANVTWILAWDSEEARAEGFKPVLVAKAGPPSGPSIQTLMATCRWKRDLPKRTRPQRRKGY